MIMPLQVWKLVSNNSVAAAVLVVAETDVGIMDYSIPVAIAAPIGLVLCGAIRVLYKANENKSQWQRDMAERLFDEEVRRARSA